MKETIQASTASLASSKRSKTSKSTKSSKGGCSEHSSKKSKRSKSTMTGNEKDESKAKARSSSGIGRAKSPRRSKSRSKTPRPRIASASTFIIKPPPDITAYLQNVLLSAIQSHRSRVKMLDGATNLLEIRLVMKQRKIKRCAITSHRDNPSTKTEHLRLSDDGTIAKKASAKGKKSKKQEKKKKKDSSNREERPSRMQRSSSSVASSSRSLQTIVEKPTKRVSKKRVAVRDVVLSTEISSTAGSRPTEAESIATPIVEKRQDPIHPSYAETGNDAGSGFSVGQGIYQANQSILTCREVIETPTPGAVAITSKPPKSPRKSVDLDEGAESISAPRRSRSADRGSMHESGRKKETKTQGESSSSDSDVEYASSSPSSKHCGSQKEYHSGKRWDDEIEEAYISPDEGGYVSPDDVRYTLPNASDYVSPLDSPSHLSVSVSIEEAQKTEWNWI